MTKTATRKIILEATGHVFSQYERHLISNESKAVAVLFTLLTRHFNRKDYEIEINYYVQKYKYFVDMMIFQRQNRECIFCLEVKEKKSIRPDHILSDYNKCRTLMKNGVTRDFLVFHLSQKTPSFDIGTLRIPHDKLYVGIVEENLPAGEIVTWRDKFVQKSKIYDRS